MDAVRIGVVDTNRRVGQNGLMRTDSAHLSSLNVTTAQAAEIVGIGYEGLRTYLKRGLLGSSGLMSPFVGRDTPAPDLSRVRAKWTRFSFTDLCMMRLAKQLMDSGLPFDAANGIVSNEEVRSYFTARAEANGALLLAWPPHYDNILFARDDFQFLPQRLSELGSMGVVNVLVQLDPIKEHVSEALLEGRREIQ